MPNTLSVLVLASGRGSNLQALHCAQQRGELNIQLLGVLSDKADSGALKYAEQHSIAHRFLDPKSYSTREQFDCALMQLATEFSPELIVCAGFMRIISEAGIAAAPCPMINIHPSLLPLYPGLQTHARALADKQSAHGASVHVVNQILDGGKILSQARVPIYETDTAEQLASRVLAREHPLLIATVRAIAQEKLHLHAVQPASVLWLHQNNLDWE